MSKENDKSINNIFDFDIDIDAENILLDHEQKAVQGVGDGDELTFDFFSKSISLVSERNYSRKQIKRAGRQLRKREGNLKEAIQILHSFRSEHAQAMNTVERLISRYYKIKQVKTVSFKRLKRLESVVDKLRRPTLNRNQDGGICITNMQHIAGCRFVFPDLKDIERFQNEISQLTNPNSRVVVKKIDDYISNPKKNDCGYRCLHIVFDYRCREKKSYLVEVQLRTELQNVWATAVEIIDIVIGTSIKTSANYQSCHKSNKQQRWEQLLELMSQYIAHLEEVSRLSKIELISISLGLKKLDKELDAVRVLSSFSLIQDKKEILESGEESSQKKHYILFLINIKNKAIELSKKVGTDRNIALSQYASLEKTHVGDRDKNILLISTEDINSLETSYPNYFGNGDAFLRLLNQAMENKL